MVQHPQPELFDGTEQLFSAPCRPLAAPLLIPGVEVACHDDMRVVHGLQLHSLQELQKLTDGETRWSVATDEYDASDLGGH